MKPSSRFQFLRLRELAHDLRKLLVQVTEAR
jgi:hypothetical protein